MGMKISKRNRLMFIDINRSMKEKFSLAQCCYLKSLQKMLSSSNLAFSVHFIALQVGLGWQYSNNE